MFTKSDAKKQLRTLLAPAGFRVDGNYFRRDDGVVRQALYLQASRFGHHYYPEMLVTFADLAPTRRNTQADAHLRARLSRIYHPDGDPRLTARREWFVRYDIEDEHAQAQLAQLRQAVPLLLDWLASWTSWQDAAVRMTRREHAIAVERYWLFKDLGQPVPVPA